MKRFIFTILLVSGQLLANHAFAANHYVRAGASGNGSGNDWSNAYPSLPQTLVRGDTYYVAAGNYPAYYFNDPLSGSSLITIKKAIASDHGTDTGWQAAYANQAIFNSILRFDTGNYVFDGQTRNESDWFDAASYGFQVYHNNTELQNIVIGATNTAAASNVTIKHTYINAPYKKVPWDRGIRQYAVDTDTWGGDGTGPHTGLVFTRMYVRGSNNVWFLRNTNGAIVEYSASEGVQSTPANHGEIVNLYYTGANATIRYNKWKDAYIGHGGTALVAITNPHKETANGLSFYGNIVWDFEVSDASIGYGGITSNNKVFNNTFIRGVGWNSGVVWGQGTNNLTYNNLFINCKTVRIDGTHNYNAFSDSDARGESNAQTNTPTTIFNNYTGNDFTLKSPTTAGMTLSSPYNIDLRGVTRAIDGTWDKGAFEYGGPTGGLITLQPPSNLRTL
jgi:hypothetical protein